MQVRPEAEAARKKATDPMRDNLPPDRPTRCPARGPGLNYHETWAAPGPPRTARHNDAPKGTHHLGGSVPEAGRVRAGYCVSAC